MLVRTLLRTAFTSLLLSTTQCPISPSSFIPSRHSFRGINPWPVSLNEFFVVDNQVGMKGRGENCKDRSRKLVFSFVDFSAWLQMDRNLFSKKQEKNQTNQREVKRCRPLFWLFEWPNLFECVFVSVSHKSEPPIILLLLAVKLLRNRRGEARIRTDYARQKRELIAREYCARTRFIFHRTPAR